MKSLNRSIESMFGSCTFIINCASGQLYALKNHPTPSSYSVPNSF